MKLLEMEIIFPWCFFLATAEEDAADIIYGVVPYHTILTLHDGTLEGLPGLCNSIQCLLFDHVCESQGVFAVEDGVGVGHG